MKVVSIQSRVTLWIAAVVGLALVAFGAGAAWNLHDEMVEKIDLEIKSEARDFFDGVKQEPVDWSNMHEVESLFAESKRLRYIEIIDPVQRVLYHSHKLAGHAFPLPSDHQMHSIKWGDHTVRFGIFRNPAGLTLALGKDLGETNEIFRDLFLSYALSLPLVLIVVALGGWWITRRALAPVQAITARAERISVSDLGQRLPDLPEADEIGHLTRVLNQMFDRLQASFAQVTRFTADASHELKTPLALMRVGAEGALADPLEPGAEKALIEIIEQTTRLSHIIDSLLFLSRADDQKLKLEFQRLDLVILMKELLEDVEILVAPSALQLQRNLPEFLFVGGDAQLLGRAVMNLLDNAIKYNNHSGTVILSACESIGKAVVSIRNTGPGLRPGDEVRVFDRFFRGDPSHSGMINGYGLGLSLTREIAHAHGGEVCLVKSDRQWTEFHLMLPLAIPSYRASVLSSCEASPAKSQSCSKEVTPAV